MMTTAAFKELLLDGKKKSVILDTDTFNEIDDQFALAYAMLSPDKVDLLAITAAPFSNSRAKTPAYGVEQSYNEAMRIRNFIDKNASVPVYMGSKTYLPSGTQAVPSEAADAIVRLVREHEETVYIVAVGAITNVASAILQAPDILQKAVVIWLGGHALHHADNHEFNLYQDVAAAQVVFDSGIPLVHIPCVGVCTEFLTTIHELNYYLAGKNELCDYLLQATDAYLNRPGKVVQSKVIWDVTAVAAITRPDTLDMVEIPRPIVTDNELYAFDMARPPYIYVRRIKRDALYLDLFDKLANK